MAERSPEDRELVQAFLDKWEGVSGPEIERRVPGVTQSDVSRWRNDRWTRLTAAKSLALEEDLARDSGSEPTDFDEGVAFALGRVEEALADLRLRTSTLRLRAGEGGGLRLIELFESFERDLGEEKAMAQVDALVAEAMDRSKLSEGAAALWEGFKLGRGHAQATGPSRRHGSRVLLQLGQTLEDEGRLDLAERSYATACDLAATEGAAARQMEAARRLARSLRKQARWEEAEGAYSRATDAALRSGDQAGYGLVLTGLAELHRDRGNLPRAREIAHEVIEIARQLENKELEARGHHNLLILDMLQGDYFEAIRHGTSALRLVRDPRQRVRVLGDVANLALRMGDLRLAEMGLESTRRKAVDQTLETSVLGSLLLISALRDDDRRVDEILETAGSLRSRSTIPSWGEFLYEKGLALHWLGRESDAAIALGAALEYAEEWKLGQTLFLAEQLLESLGDPRPDPESFADFEPRNELLEMIQVPEPPR